MASHLRSGVGANLAVWGKRRGRGLRTKERLGAKIKASIAGLREAPAGDQYNKMRSSPRPSGGLATRLFLIRRAGSRPSPVRRWVKAAPGRRFINGPQKLESRRRQTKAAYYAALP